MNINELRREFPFFNQEDGRVIYFDNGATTQKPRAVINRLVQYYTVENSNIHRGNYPLSNRTERMYEQARKTIAEWLDAAEASEIVFTKGSTEAINLAASAIADTWLKPGDNIIVTELEHSSNYFPWKHHCEKQGADFLVATASEDGSLSADAVISRMNSHTRLVSVTAMSNVTGFRPAIATIISEAHRRGIYVFVDASQEVAHHPLSVRSMDCDFLCFSGHKIYGPMGTGILYGKRELLEELQPYLYGGDMVEKGDGGCIRYKKDPGKFEAGTQNIGGVLGLEAALGFLKEHDFPELVDRENELGNYLSMRLQEIPGLHICGLGKDTPVMTFEVEGLGAYDLGVLLGNRGIAVRSGAHCAYPLLKRMRKDSICRVSLSFYNTHEEIDQFVSCLKDICRR